MPKFLQQIPVSNINSETAFAIAYQTFKTLGWNVLLAGDVAIIAQTPGKWKAKGQEIRFGFENGEASVQSEMLNGESFDLGGKNKKNTAAFTGAFNNVKQSITPENIQSNIAAINILREETKITLDQEQKEAEEVSKAMNLAGSNLYFTYGIIIINVLVFVLMVLDGAGIITPNGLVHIKWGSNFAPLTLSGDYWRLVTNIFIHFGVIHLLMNMYCLYSIGVYLEPMLGKKKYAAAYFCTGILASVVSLWWHTEPANSAGASGAIFGMYGLFFALLTTDLIPKKVRMSLLQNIGIFIFYNLAYGMKSGVDNSAHIGGLISGFAIGYLYVINIRTEKKGGRAQWVLPAVIILSLGIAAFYLQAHPASSANRTSILTELKNTDYKDDGAYNDKYDQFIVNEKNAMAVISDTTLNNKEMKHKLQEVSVPQWNNAERLAEEMQNMNVSDAKHKRANAVALYISLRKEEINAAYKVLDELPAAQDSLIAVREKIRRVLQELSSP